MVQQRCFASRALAMEMLERWCSSQSAGVAAVMIESVFHEKSPSCDVMCVDDLFASLMQDH